MRKRKRILCEKEQPMSVSLLEPEATLWSQCSDRDSLGVVRRSLRTKPVHVCIYKQGCAVWEKKEIYLDFM